MKHLSYFTALAVTLILGLCSSCAPKDDLMPDEATLSLSATAVTIDNAGGNAQPITVTTNQPKWNAISNVEWLKTDVSGNTLNIIATPNEGGADRAAEILIVAGATNEKISVVQSAADIVLEVTPENIVVTNAGETKLVSVKSNSASWTLEIDEAASAWLTQTVFKDFIQLVIAPNEGEARETKLYAKSGNTQKEITIQQAGSNSSPFIIPFLSVDATQYQILSYETKQGSFLVSYEAPDPGYAGLLPPVGENYTFATSSALFPSAFYLYNYDTSMLEVVEYVATKSLKDVVAEGYVDFLIEKGFEDAKYDETEGTVTGTHKENRFIVEMGDSKNGVAIAHFKAPAPEQPQDYPTFTEFPYDNSYMLSDTQYTSAKVKEVETAAKSTLDVESDDEDFPGNVGMQIYTLDAGLAPKINRAYFFDNETKDANGNAVNNVSEIMVMWSNVNLAFWEVQPGNYSLTNEFKALLEKSGFIFFLESNGLNFYYNDAKKLVVVPSIKTFTDINDGLPIFMMNYFAYDAGGASAGVKAKIAKEITARIEAQYKKLGAK